MCEPLLCRRRIRWRKHVLCDQSAHVKDLELCGELAQPSRHGVSLCQENQLRLGYGLVFLGHNTRGPEMEADFCESGWTSFVTEIFLRCCHGRSKLMAGIPQRVVPGSRVVLPHQPTTDCARHRALVHPVHAKPFDSWQVDEALQYCEWRYRADVFRRDILARVVL